jgi:hypothetical protein
VDAPGEERLHFGSVVDRPDVDANADVPGDCEVVFIGEADRRL